MIPVWLILGLLPLVTAVPQVTLPVNSQVPPVGYVSQPFSFIFSESTFTSGDGNISYELSNAPSWLSLNSQSRMFSGIPEKGDLGSSVVQLIAKDATGASTLSATFIVVSGPAPSITRPLSDQLPSFGKMSDPSSLLISPSTAFTFAFAPDTFSGIRGLHKYAVSSDGTPLPSWLHFDPANLSFSGTTPEWTSLLAPPQGFGFKLSTSDVAGFSEAAAAFEIMVGTHELYFSNTTRSLNVMRGSPINVTDLRESLFLDGRPVNASELEGSTAEAPSWITFDEESLHLSGVTPNNAKNTKITISVSDVYGDTASLTLELRVPTSLILQKLGNVNATIGKTFNYSISRSSFADPNVKITSVINPPLPWLVFDAKNLAWRGTVPRSSHTGVAKVVVNASSDLLQVSESQTFTIRIQQGLSPTIAVVPSQSSSSTGVPVKAGASNTTIAIAVSVPLGILFAALVAVIVCLRKKRKRDKLRPHSPSPREISRPLQPGEATASLNSAPPSSETQPPPGGRTPSHTPMSTPWHSTLESARSHSYDTTSQGTVIRPTSMVRGSNGSNSTRSTLNFSYPARTYSIRRESMSPPPIPEKSPSRSLLPIYSPSSPRMSRIFSESSLFTTGNRRLSGIGPGAPNRRSKTFDSLMPPARDPPTRSQSWMTMKSGDDGSVMTESTSVLNDFPNPPLPVASRHPQSPTIRLVRNSSSRDPSRLSASRSERYGSRRGGSSYFAASSSGSSRKSRRRGRPSSSIPQSPREPEDDQTYISTIDSYLMELSGQENDEESEEDNRGSPMWLDTPSPQREAFHTMDSHLNRDASQVSRHLSDLSGQFQSAIESSPDLARNQGAASLEEDRESMARWYENTRENDSRAGSRLDSRIYEDMGEEQLAVPVTVSRLTIDRTRLSAMAAPSSSAGTDSARLVDFKPGRPVSDHTKENLGEHQRWSSASGTLAFI